ncbi:MAG: hypothetical protein V1894_04735 [Chloroflexota bacterium]
MSKLIEKLNQILRPTPPPMGFGRSQPVPPKARMLIIASETSDSLSGADGVLLDSMNKEVLTGIAKTSPDLPWGVSLSRYDSKQLAGLTKSGADFVVFTAENTSLGLLSHDKLGKILEVEPSLADSLLRTVNELPVDAVLLALKYEGETSLSWYHLMLSRRFASLLTKPLLVLAPQGVTGKELLALWEAGVSGVVVPAERVKELKEESDRLTFPERRLSRMGALIPRLSQETPKEPGEDEEEEEEP